MTMTMRTLIVDDESLARERLLGFCRDVRDLEVIGTCANGIEAVEAIRAEAPDLVFLDVQMPEVDGFGVLAQLKGALPLIVFVTAYDQYAVQAFEVQALDYLLKPFDKERFGAAVDRARARLAGPGADSADDLAGRIEALLDGLRDRHLKRVAIKDGERISIVAVEQIENVTSAGNYVEIQAAGRSHLLRATLSHLEHRLDPARFRRIHRSTIVNLDQIQELRADPHGDHIVVLRSGKELTLSRNYRDRLREFLGGEV